MVQERIRVHFKNSTIEILESIPANELVDLIQCHNLEDFTIIVVSGAKSVGDMYLNCESKKWSRWNGKEWVPSDLFNNHDASTGKTIVKNEGSSCSTLTNINHTNINRAGWLTFNREEILY